MFSLRASRLVGELPTRMWHTMYERFKITSSSENRSNYIWHTQHTANYNLTCATAHTGTVIHVGYTSSEFPAEAWFTMPWFTAAGCSSGLVTARCYASAVLAMAVCPSVRPSVRLTQVGVLLNLENGTR